MTLSFWPNKLMFKGAERASMRWPKADLRWSLLLSCNQNKWMQREKLRCDYTNNFSLVGHSHPG
jgi:hypothetical protein